MQVVSGAGSSRRRRSDSEVSRRKVLDTVVECILDVGYYKTSTNEIARRAGVTWGTLQYQFGNRDMLLIEVLNDRWGVLEATLSEAEITGETLEDRLTQVLEVLDTYYGQPAHLAGIQILLDLTHNPDTSAELRNAVADHSHHLVTAWQPLFLAALGEAAAHEDLARFAFVVLRGYLMGFVISSSLAEVRRDRATREMLVFGVAAAIRAEAGRRGIELV